MSTALQPRLFKERETIRERFETFHRANPRVYELLVKFARQVREAGYSHYSIDALFHRIRWHVRIETRSPDPFKLNDHFTALYARKIMDELPDEFRDFFETRERRSE